MSFSMPPQGPVRALLFLGLVCLLIVSPAWAVPPAAARQAAGQSAVEAALEDSGKGDVFSLEVLQARSGDTALATLAQARIASSRLRYDEALPLLEKLVANERNPRRLAMAWSMLADIRFAAGDYAGAAGAARAWRDLLDRHGDPEGDAAGAANMASVAGRLAETPAQRRVSFAPQAVPVERDKVGLLRAVAMIQGKPQQAVLDTGANLSVVSLSTARRLGLRVLEGEATVGSASRDAVATRIGVAERLEFAGLALSNVAFLVLDDAQLQLPVPGGYAIDAILGFPILRELRRLRFEDGRLTPEPDVDADGTPENLRIVGSDLFVDAAVNGRHVALHLDSGATRTSLSRLFADRHPEIVEGLPEIEERMAGAGGATVQRSALWPKVRIAIGERRTSLPEMAIAIADGDAKARNFGVLGRDVLERFESWTLDLDRMRLELGPEKIPAPDQADSARSGPDADASRTR